MFKNWSRNYKFKRLLSRDSQDGESEAEEQFLSEKALFPNRPQGNKQTHLLSGIIGGLLGVLGTLIFLWVSRRYLSGKNADIKQCSYWSPVLDDIEIPTYTTRINATVFSPPNPSVARQEPGPENDALWDDYERALTHVITREDVIKLGKNPDTAARFDDEFWGFGPEAYMGQLDVMHHIHCLNMLRKAAFTGYPGYDPPRMENQDDKMRWVHLGHCVDMILENIKCNANPDLITLAWVEGKKVPWADFSIMHKCRDFDTILKWNKEHSVDADKFDRTPMPKGSHIFPSPWLGESELGYPLGNHHQQEGGLKMGGNKSHDSSE